MDSGNQATSRWMDDPGARGGGGGRGEGRVWDVGVGSFQNPGTRRRKIVGGQYQIIRYITIIYEA